MQPLTLNPEDIQSFAPALRNVYNEVYDRGGQQQPLGRRPYIGVSGHLTDRGSAVARAYTQSVEAAGGIPVILPVTTDLSVLEDMLERVDGLIFTGGGDFDPVYQDQAPVAELDSVSEQEDLFNLKLAVLALQRNIPTLAICRGMQLINLVLGGSLYQDIYLQHPNRSTLLKHNPGGEPVTPTHSVTLSPIAEQPSLLSSLLGHLGTTFEVNSIHHQAVERVARGATVTATAPDGVAEAMELMPHKPVLCVQWHPERLGTTFAPLFTWLVQEAGYYASAVAIHRTGVVLDSHTDTPMTVYWEGGNGFAKQSDALVDLPKMQQGRVSAVCMAAYIPQKELSPQGYARAAALTQEKLSQITALEEKAPCRVCHSPRQVREAVQAHLPAVIPVVENAYGLGEQVDNLLTLYNSFRPAYITLCHNGDNQFCDAALKGAATHAGLSPLGRELLEAMQRLGVMIDLSHAADSTVEQVLQLARVPVIASHSGARALCNSGRNLPDALIKGIAATGGVIQVPLYPGFVSNSPQTASVRQVVDHIGHIVQLTGSTEHVGIGSDFDGGASLLGCAAINDWVNITVELLRRDYSPEQVTQILGGNFLRVWQAVQDFAQAQP